MKVAIVTDWLVGGGGEKVVEQLHKLYPEAPIYSSYATGEWRKRLGDKVVTGFLQQWPFSVLRKYVGLLRIWWFRHLNLSDFDLVIAVTGNGEAKFVRPPKTATYICYCHTPVHYLWRHYEDYIKNPGFAFGSIGLRLLAKPLRTWDYKAAQRPDFYIANSNPIKADIQKYYHQDSKTIFPPVQTSRFNKNLTAERNGFITVGRLVPYKHVEIIVKACHKLDLPLTVVGRGPELQKLKNLAGPTISFDADADDQAVSKYMQAAEGFIFAAHEDFGITPVEAMAAGTPVIAYKAGGALDYVTENKTGLFFEKQTSDSLAKVLKEFQPTHFKPKTVSARAEKFSESVFRQSIKKFIEEACSE